MGVGRIAVLIRSLLEYFYRGMEEEGCERRGGGETAAAL